MAGIGHVRWATHGEVNQANAHPHLDCKQQIAVVHNGIIENYRELRERLKSRHKFVSQTDTEVIPHLIEEYMDSGASLEEAVRLLTNELKGCYVILAISIRESKKIVGVCKDAPLIIGLGKHGNFITNDVLSFLKQTRNVVYLQDGEIAVLSEGKVSILDQGGEEVKREVQEIQWQWDDATKEGYEHFMLKEIMEQPGVIRRALMQDKKLLMDTALDILRARQVILTACGTSRYAALLGRYLFSQLAKKFCDVVMASELEYFSDSIDRNTLVVAVSQSGETADVLAGVNIARKNGATIFSIVNRVGSLLDRLSDRVLYLNCGPEVGVAATKSFTAQLVIFYLLAFAMANRLDEGIEKIRAISALIEQNFHENRAKIKQLAWQLKDAKDCYYIARGSNLHIAGEGALKLKEIAYIHADGMPAGELKHGTLALIEKGTPVVAICPRDYTFYHTLSNVEEAKSRGAFIIGVSDHREDAFDQWIKIPEVEENFYPLVSVVPLQLLAYHVAIARGLDPDKPRNLAKSVTVK
jgi:glucosamine--fructose-6-phosphate aminotransferase (isomerizing)